MDGYRREKAASGVICWTVTPRAILSASERNPLNCAFGPVTVPEGNYWVMGDNRGNSADSRYHMGDEFQGTVPGGNIIGKVQAIILPFNRIGSVPSPDINAG